MTVTAFGSATEPMIVILIPCYNEDLTVGDVVRQFRLQLPHAEIHVFDNNSEDRTIEEALRAGAIVSQEKRRGKGYVVQSMFHQIDADVYVMVDGDGTYPAESVGELIKPIMDGKADMVVGSRLLGGARGEFKLLNYLGNRLFLLVLRSIFNFKPADILSGYRAFNRSFVKDMAILARGFEIEAELTIKALERGYRIIEVPIRLGNRPKGSYSKIRIFRDGRLILNTILSLFRDYKPLTFFGSLGLVLFAAGLIPGLIVIVEFFKTGLVARLPSAILAVGLILSGMLSIAVGLTLHTIVHRFQELEHSLRNLAKELRTNSVGTEKRMPGQGSRNQHRQYHNF